MTGPAARRGWAGRIRDEWLLGLFAGLALVLAVADPQPPAAHVRWLQPSTLCALAGLLITIEGIRDSGLVQRAAAGMIARLHSSRAVGLFLVTLAAVLSTVLTNDVSLFLVVPLTVAIGGVADLPVGRLVVFEALAVNAGSTLSPIGSPQNLLIWQRSGLPFPAFVLFMAPVAAIMFAMTAAVTWFGVPRGPVAPRVEQRDDPAVSRALAVASTAGLALMTAAIELGVAPLGAAVVAAAFALGARRTLGRVDWWLVATFAALFLALGHVAVLPIVGRVLGAVDFADPLAVYLAGIIGSQLISNVPATVLLLDRVPDVMALAVAVDVGGYGLVFGSLANLIALRLARRPRGMRLFHAVSVPFLLACAPIVYLVLHGRT